MTADPSSGTIPTGYLILNVAQGTLKRHAGGYTWETVVGATGGKIGFYGATPVVQPAGTDQAAVTLGNTDGEFGGLTISNPPTQAEVRRCATGAKNWPMTFGRWRLSFTPCGRCLSPWGR